MTLSTNETIAIIVAVMLGTMATRFLPFVLFRGGRGEGPYLRYLGAVLPAAVIGLLVVYCLKELSFAAPVSWLPTVLASALVVALQWRKGNALLSIGAGTAVYMAMVNLWPA